MANAKQLAILKQGVEAWNGWREEHSAIRIDLSKAYLRGANLYKANLSGVDLDKANLLGADIREAKLDGSSLYEANLLEAVLHKVDFSRADLSRAILAATVLWRANLSGARLLGANLNGANLKESNFSKAWIGNTIFGNSDLSEVKGLDDVNHSYASTIGTNTIFQSKGLIPESFLRGCGLNDWEIEETKLCKTDLSHDEVNQILRRMYDLRTNQTIQVSQLFISYSHADSEFVDKIASCLTDKGIRYWRDIHEMKAGRIERQIESGIHQNPTVLLVLSEHSTKSDWVEHEVRTARGLEKEVGRDALCPIALDDSWKSSRWPKRVMEQIMEYNILDFSAWRDDSKFDGMFRRLIDGLELFYKG
jgi:hypothetical protein